MMLVRFVVPLALLLVVACSSTEETGAAGSNPPPPDPVTDEDERGSVGVPPPAGEYCAKLGYPIEGQDCVLPDGTRCEQWSFYRGECGQAYSYCNQHGGTISKKTEDMGGWTAVYGVCDVNGKSCKESTFFVTGKCE
jgi:putative hemolysin